MNGCNSARIEDSPALTGRVHSVETGGTVDGPGVRFVVFFTGCPLSCKYCHNPDTRSLCDGKETTVDSLCDEIKSYVPFLTRAKGGVTLSGGEPLMQPAFARAVLQRCKAMGLHTALDTSGYLGHLADDALLEATDLVLLDIKSGLPDTYRETTGVKLEPTLTFARRLSAMGKAIWVRFVLVPGLTDASENVDAVARICASIKTIERIDILPFHKMGEYKWDHLQLTYSLKNTRQADEEDVAKARAAFLRHGLQAF